MDYKPFTVLALLALAWALLQWPAPHPAKTILKYVIATVLVVTLLFGAFITLVSPPRYLDTFKTPLPGVTLTYQTESLPLTSDSNWLTAHYEHNGKRDSKVILYGDDASFYRYVWAGPERLELCWRSGHIFDFTNDVDLQAGGGAQHFHVVLREDCTPNP